MRPAPSPLAFALLVFLALPLPSTRSADNSSSQSSPTTPAQSPAPTPERERLQRIAAEVQRRRQLREAAVADARRLLAEHESGQAPATAAALAAARKIVDDSETARTRPTPATSDRPSKIGTTPGPNDRVRLRLPDTDMQTVATVWKLYFNEVVKISDRVKHKTVTAILDEPFGTMRPKLEAVLLKHGIAVIAGPDGKYFDAAPAAHAP